MPLSFQNVTVILETGTGRRDVRLTRRFDAPFASETSVDAAIKGFSLDYTRKDHHINIVAVDIDILSIRRELGEVEFLVQVLYGDKNLDDPYNGFINVLLIAELEASGNGPVDGIVSAGEVGSPPSVDLTALSKLPGMTAAAEIPGLAGFMSRVAVPTMPNYATRASSLASKAPSVSWRPYVKRRGVR